MGQETKTLITTNDGIKLHAEVEDNAKDKWLIITHGVGEYLGRHRYFSNLVSSQYNILYYDLRGHGQSEGRPTWINNFWQYMEDLDKIVTYLQNTHKMKRYTLFGHSMGALIVSGYLQRYFTQGLAFLKMGKVLPITCNTILKLKTAFIPKKSFSVLLLSVFQVFWAKWWMLWAFGG